MRKISTILFLILVFAFGTMKAQDIENLYVSVTGWAQWDELENADGYMVRIDNQQEFEIEKHYFQHQVDEFQDGERHNIMVASIFDGTIGNFSSFDWIYSSCEHYEGFVSVPQGGWQGDDIVLNWELPQAPQDDSFFESFETGIPQNWGLIDADGDNHWWYLASVFMPAPQYTFFPHTGEDMICSESFSNMIGVGALHPDNYIVTHKVHVTESSTFSFWACAQDASYPFEHFGVAVSSESQTNPADFTMLHEWTLSAKDSRNGTWYQYTVDLSAYAGQEVYIAIRHFNCTDQFYLNVDDVEFSNNGTSAAGIIGTLIIRDGESYDIVPGDTNSYTDVAPDHIDHEYNLRVIYDGEESDFTHFAMSCEEIVLVADPTNVDENNYNRISVFPNPAVDAVTIQCEGIQQVTIFNSIGQMMFTSEANGNQLQIDLSEFQVGYYIIQARTKNSVMTKKLIVE